MEVEDKEEVSSLENDKFVSLMREGHILVGAQTHPVEALL